LGFKIIFGVLPLGWIVFSPLGQEEFLGVYPLCVFLWTLLQNVFEPFNHPIGLAWEIDSSNMMVILRLSKLILTILLVVGYLDRASDRLRELLPVENPSLRAFFL
jgi:hypothetical protein